MNSDSSSVIDSFGGDAVHGAVAVKVHDRVKVYDDPNGRNRDTAMSWNAFDLDIDAVVVIDGNGGMELVSRRKVKHLRANLTYTSCEIRLATLENLRETRVPYVTNPRPPRRSDVRPFSRDA
jgi:hypothetical protein